VAAFCFTLVIALVHITLSLPWGGQKTQKPARMKRWQTALATLAALSASLALGEDFKTIQDKEYKDATVIRVEADGIVLRTKSGIVKLYFSELPKEVRERFDGTKTTAAATPHQTSMREAKPRLVAATEKLQKRGLLSLDCSEPDAKAWIALAAWRTFDAQEKENMTKNLAAYCHTQYSSISILDKRSGRKLASYSPSRGFQAY
jgi:hypothetical protein